MGRINLQDARHLSMRSGLGVRWKDLQRYQNLPKTKSIQHIVYSASNRWMLPPPKLAEWTPWSAKQTPQHRQHLHRRLNSDKQALKQWTVQNMLRTPYPLTERMVLFWHNHFTSSINKVNQPNLLLKQNILFRRHGLANFKKLLHEVSRDPAMLIYLDNDYSTAGKPNENFARELLELFTLGEGNYSEADILSAAQAFTGWTVDRRNKRFVFRKDLHDNSVKTFMGKRGRLNGNHIIDRILQSPHASEHIAEKFWAEFVSDERPNPHTIRRWGNSFRHANYDIRTLLVTVLNSREFWSSHNRGEKIKSPVELVIGTLRSLVIKPPSVQRIVNICDALGQKILTPETPQGYSGGQEWVDTYTLPVRINVMAELINKSSALDIARIPNIPVAEKENWLLARKPIRPTPSHTQNRKQSLHTLLTDPAYQLI
ncbi:MAG TPA: DUF1800 domain-containing protein [Leucothrix mucor]|nr:DUF1800 domain-containing protein [Leucothrix mucor]